MASRRLDDLQEVTRSAAEEFLRRAAQAGLDILIYCTRRTLAEQARLWRMGRARSLIERVVRRLYEQGRAWVAELVQSAGPQPGRRVLTNALPGESAHNYGYAFDAVPLVHGKPAWGDRELLRRMGDVGREVGLEWAGDWERFPEQVHFQTPGWRDRVARAEAQGKTTERSAPSAEQD
jgi:peptidoglycan L-alanyl-D-glutamate endopeptidase CwlK